MTDDSSSLKTAGLQRGAGFDTLWAIEHCKPSLLLIYGERGDISPHVKTDRMLRIGDVLRYEAYGIQREESFPYGSYFS